MGSRVTCEACDQDIGEEAPATCSRCVDIAINCAVDETSPDCDHPSAAEEIRRWANWRFAKGQIGAGLRDELEQAAEDIECGHS